MYSPNSFCIQHIAVLIMFIMLYQYFISLVLVYLVTGTLYFLTPFATSHFLYSERTVNSYDEGHLKIGFSLIVREDVGEFSWASDGAGTWNSPDCGPR